QEMVWRVVEDVRTGEPAIAIGDAEGDISAGAKAGNDSAQERGGLGLMLEHFKECDDVVFCGRILGDEIDNAERKDVFERELLAREFGGTGVQLRPRDAKTFIAR